MHLNMYTKKSNKCLRWNENACLALSNSASLLPTKGSNSHTQQMRLIIFTPFTAWWKIVFIISCSDMQQRDMNDCSFELNCNFDLIVMTHDLCTVSLIRVHRFEVIFAEQICTNKLCLWALVQCRYFWSSLYGSLFIDSGWSLSVRYIYYFHCECLCVCRLSNHAMTIIYSLDKFENLYFSNRALHKRCKWFSK